MTIVSNIVTGSKSYEEVLDELEQAGIEWYITEGGDWMIRYWQVGAEDFAPSEKVGELRSRNPATMGAEALEWTSKHLDELMKQYGGKWIAVADASTVVASSDSLSGLMEQLRETDLEEPFVTQIPTGTVVWHTMYAK
jgi:hypothetical protein